MKEKIAKLVTIVSALLGIMAAVAKNLSEVDELLSTILLYAFACIFIICLVLLVIFYLIDLKREKKGKQSSSVAKTAALYIKQLFKLTKEVDKKLNKVFVYNVKKAYKKEQKHVIKSDARERQENKDKKSRTKKPSIFKRLFKNKYYTTVRYEVIPFSDFILTDAGNENKLDRFFTEAQKLCKEILSLSRTLIQISQNNMRIKLGRFVAKYTTSDMDAIKAYVDLIGFTYILDGEFNAGKEALEVASNLIDKKLSTNPSAKDYIDCMMQKARIKRHLSTTYYTYEKNKENLKTIEEGKKILNDEDIKKYYALEDKIVGEGITLEYKEEYYRMLFGYDTNEILHLLYDYYYAHKNDLIVNAYEKISLIQKDIKMLELMKKNHLVFDRHRYMKLLSLEAQIVRILKMNGISVIEGATSSISIDDIDVSDILEKIEEIIGDNIYFDDALEMYTNEKIHYCYKEADRIINKKDKFSNLKGGKHYDN